MALLAAGAPPPNAQSGVVSAADEPMIAGYDEAHVTIDLRENGSAVWTVEYRYRLDDENATEEWTERETDVDARPGVYVEAFGDRWEETLEEARNETDREMNVTNLSVATDSDRGVHDYGYVRFTFKWTSFAHVEMNRIEVGDALVGFVLDDDTRLRVSWPAEYNLSAVEPEPDERREGTVSWHGDETEFVDDEPHLELLRTGEDPVEVEEPAQWPLLEDVRSLEAWQAAIGALAVAVLVLAAMWWRRRANRRRERLVDREASSEEPPPELLSNEERVLRLLEQRGGRMKQQDVVAELEWTEAKTSQVVGELRENGRVDVFRIGRENVLTLVEEEEAEQGAE